MNNNFQQAARVAAIAAMAVVIGAGGASAYPAYNDNATPVGFGAGCVDCHNEFESAGALHGAHLNGFNVQAVPGTIDSRCNVCHSDGGGTTPVYTMGSNETQGNGLGCVGCHGQDYGETVQTSTLTYDYQGLPKASGYGLRLVHANAGVAVCATCHTPNPFVPLGEDVAPPYYTLGVSDLTNPCLSTQEDNTFDVDTVGLDNDGNGLADLDDPACAGVTTTSTTTSTTTTTLPATCGVAPAGGCFAAEKAKLQVSEKTPGKEKVKFQLVKLTSSIVQADFGDPLPLSGTSYALCIYDQANTLVASYEVAQAGQDCGTKPCWQDAKGLGYKYSDKFLGADGISKIQLAGGVAGKGKVKVLGKNTESTLPTGIAALLSGDTAATAQLITNNAQCFGMSLPTVKKNDGLVFQAQAP